MLDEVALRIVAQVVREWVRNGRMFTAQDVTAEARLRGGVVNDADVRNRLLELFQQGMLGGEYTWTHVDLGTGERIHLFHRLGDQPWQYRGARGLATPPPPQAPRGLWGWLLSVFFGSQPEATQQVFPTRGPIVGNPFPSALPTPTPQRTPQPFRQRQSKLLNLDAAQFLPISRDELRDKASTIDRWGSPWFGRRDLIPPVSDPRTLLIDRALVSNGILSPEQLAEIHRVGAEMDRVRPDILMTQQKAARAGTAAVEEDRAARASLKAKKKEEVARRKERRKAEIAHRREHDIIFLGRGVSGRLSERASNLAKLNALNLPVLSTPAELAAALQITVRQLRWLAFHNEVASRTHYVHFTVPKRSGGVRVLSAPHKKLKAAQQWILRTILDKLPVEPAAQGFVANRSTLSNAREHVGKQVLINMDLEAFFPSITFPRVRSVFHRAGYSPAIATILALLCTEAPRKQVQYAGQTYYVATGPRALPQGACTSPALSNQVASRLDKRLQGIAQKLNASYTRYADDITFSGNEELKEKVGYAMARIRHIAQAEGFTVNEQKSRIQRRNASQEVTGLIVNDRPGVPRKMVRRLRAILHGARRTGLAAQNKEGRTNFSSWLQGMIAYVGMAQPELGKKMLSELNTLSP
jgi:RNA-directed DNA polymerase